MIKLPLLLEDLDVVYRTKESKHKSRIKLVFSSEIDATNKDIFKEIISFSEGGIYEVTITPRLL